MENKKHIYFTAPHRQSLKESLEDERPIPDWLGKKLIKTKIYVYYGYDGRLNAKCYILKDFHLALGFPTWLHVYDKPKGSIYD